LKNRFQSNTKYKQQIEIQQMTDIVPIISKDEVKQYISQTTKQSYVLIDVRNRDECASTSDKPLLPTAFNVPLPEFSKAFELDQDTFKQQYSFDKPVQQQFIIVYCQSGRRSAMAATQLVEKGYSNVVNYKGSALDWYQQQ
jgi:rhodanese-related sulfurtransferase